MKIEREDDNLVYNNCVLGTVAMDVDGYYYLWEMAESSYFAAPVLRALADKLDEINKPWDDQVNKELSGTN